MSKELKPGAYRIYDTQKRAYLDLPALKVESGQAMFFLNESGALIEKYLEPGDCVCHDGYSEREVDPGRYQVERFTGLYDCEKKPVYVGDVVHFEKYDTGVRAERFEYSRKHPGISPDELDKAVPHVIYHLIMGVEEGREDFELRHINKNDDFFMGHKDFRKYRHGFRIIGHVHEPFADLSARVPEYRDCLAGTDFDQNKGPAENEAPAKELLS